MIQADFWRNRRVFLTGHTGFKGSWLSLWLTQLGARVTGMALRPNTMPSLFNVAQVASGIKSVIGDIRDAHLVLETMQAAQPEIVIHMAAQPLVRYSYEHPLETYATNVMGTVHVLDAVRQLPGVRAVVIVTSDKCYENRETGHPFREEDAMGGNDPYSNSKGCAELVSAAYRLSFFNSDNYAKHGVALATARAGNVIGGGDWADDRLIPDILRALGKKQAIRIRSPGAVRPWQHVLEPLCGYLMLAQALYQHGIEFAEGWNFGSDTSDAKPVQWIADKLTVAWGAQPKWILDNVMQPHEAQLLILDSTKAGKKLNWKPAWTLEQALLRIVAWHKAHMANEDMRKFCLEEIALYTSDATQIN